MKMVVVVVVTGNNSNSTADGAENTGAVRGAENKAAQEAKLQWTRQDLRELRRRQQQRRGEGTPHKKQNCRGQGRI